MAGIVFTLTPRSAVAACLGLRGSEAQELRR
jgi:hypothetical protein